MDKIDDVRLVGLVIALAGLVVAGVSIPLILRRIPMNGFYGVRIPKSFVSDDNWYAINAYGGRVLAVAGAIISVVGLIILFRPLTSEAAIVVAAVAPAVVLVLSIIPVLMFARHLPSRDTK
jgi:uncharacterized membrane protein